MSHRKLSRREFGRAVSAAFGAAVLAPRLVEAARRPRGVPENVIQLNSNENPYGPSPHALDAMTEAQQVAARYPDALEDLVVEAIAKGHGVQPENVILGCGSGEILRMADLAFLGPEKNLVVAEPTFEAVLSYAEVTRAKPVKIPLTADHRHDLPRMAAACNENTGLVYLCNPNNPTGTIVTRDEMESFFARVPRTAIVLVDEAYHHFVEDPRYTSALAWWGRVPNLVIVRTFSKIYGMAGMRLGYAVAAREHIAALRRHRLFNNANAAVLQAALASLEDTKHVERHRKLNNETRRWVCAELERDGRRYIPSETNFVMVHVGQDVTPVIEAFRKRHILVGRKFPSLPDWLRVSIGTRKEMEVFLAALREIVPSRAAAA
ncbi:MAG: histidinol-phosphate transaminase [Firmicutes bacterium]|nr:histidinol-phosphate transaminase [Bacillota bacterium]